MTDSSTADKPLTQRLADAAAAGRGGTDYRVLRAVERGLWQPLPGDYLAKSSTAAIRAALVLLNEDEQEGTYVAVPLRSFQPVKVAVETQTRLHIEEA